MTPQATPKPSAEGSHALPQGWEKRWDEELDERVKRLPVPHKASKRMPRHIRHNARRNLVRVANAKRAAHRTARRTGRRIRNTTNWLGATYVCQICQRTVRFREADHHNAMHATLGHRYRPPTPLSEGEREAYLRQKEAERDAARAAQGVVDRAPSPTKQKALAKTTDRPAQPAPPSRTGGNPSATVPPGASVTRRLWHPKITGLGDDMANGRNGAASTPAAAVIKAHEGWADTPLTTVVDLKAHLLGMDAAWGKSADVIHSYAAQQLVARGVHPLVAKEIDNAAEALAAGRHFFTQGYLVFERVYADRLAYERDQQHKPQVPGLFGSVG
jgi:hypothetical protein